MAARKATGFADATSFVGATFMSPGTPPRLPLPPVCTRERCARHPGVTSGAPTFFHILAERPDCHVGAAGANLHAGTMRPTSGRHKWRPYVFPYTGRTTGLLRRGDIHVARDTAGAAAGAFTGGARFADPADRRYGQCDRKNGQGDRNFCRTDCFSRQGGRGGKGHQGKAST